MSRTKSGVKSNEKSQLSDRNFANDLALDLLQQPFRLAGGGRSSWRRGKIRNEIVVAEGTRSDTDGKETGQPSRRRNDIRPVRKVGQGF